ncbi:uncharacterized protein LOC126907736 isoform X3 [Daktulosphaira vitifoliae]|nr:uncharacterized protein LOC126907736 isoform X3 [Daktulosphaira vitifoliae]
MNPGLIILTLSLIQCNITYVNGKLNYKSYLNYVNKVVGHMCIQNGWKSMEKIYLNFDESSAPISVPDLMVLKFDTDNVLSIFYKMFHILNYKYNEVLLTFVELISIVIDICENFLNAELLDDFYNSTILLVNEVKNSLKMFENLYNAMAFISYVDLTLVFVGLKSNPYTIVDDIYEIKNHIYFKKIQYEFLYVDLGVFLETKNFIDDVSKIAKNFLQNNTFITNTVDKIDFKSKFDIEYLTNYTDFTNFILFMKHKINSFYNETIKINYEGLGFIQLINPTDIKFKPPIDETINQELGIMTLNTLFNEGSWSSFSHIKIQYGDLKISAESVIRDQVTDHNIHLKKYYFTHMMRCRVFEMLFIYNKSLTVLKKICKTAKLQLDLNDYVKCVTCLFDVINGTVKMFDFIMTIIEKIKLSTIWPNESLYSNLITTYNLIYKYVVDLKTNNVIRNYYVNKPEENTDILADDYIIRFQKARYYFCCTLISIKQQDKNRCYSEGLMLTTSDLEMKIQYLELSINRRMSNDTRVTK